MNINELEFEPLNRFMSSGNEIQVCKSTYKKVDIYWRTIFWWNIFQNPSDTISIDLVLPETTIVKNGRMEHCYEDEGFASPCFNTLEDAVAFIDEYLK